MSDKSARLIVHCPEHLEAVRKFADKTGQREALEQKLLDTVWGETLYTHLYQDWAPYSFYFVQTLGPKEDDKFCMNGGVIYHGQIPTNGQAQFSICLVPTTGWAIHT